MPTDVPEELRKSPDVASPTAANPTVDAPPVLAPTDTVHADEELEGHVERDAPWRDYPLDDLLIRQESRTVYDVVRRIEKHQYVLDPDFQRDFIWPEDKQSKLIESVLLRIPLPVLYLAEDKKGRMIVVDGLQRLSTFVRFLHDELALRKLDRKDLNGKMFSNLSSKLQNRIEDCNLIIYTIDSKVPDRAKLDIFDRVNSGIPLSRQQLRNCLFTGKGTQFLKEVVTSELFQEATGSSLNHKTMRDREFVNRFCAFHLFGPSEYRGNMDDFLAKGLKRMNEMDDEQRSVLRRDLQRALSNNLEVFGQHAFRKSMSGQDRRSVLNASLWDVMSTGLSRYPKDKIYDDRFRLRNAIEELLEDEDFNKSITYATNDTKRVVHRFKVVRAMLEETLG